VYSIKCKFTTCAILLVRFDSGVANTYASSKHLCQYHKLYVILVFNISFAHIVYVPDCCFVESTTLLRMYLADSSGTSFFNKTMNGTSIIFLPWVNPGILPLGTVFRL
jgi:hypothetical protein